jgi:hypothetical protein
MRSGPYATPLPDEIRPLRNAAAAGGGHVLPDASDMSGPYADLDVIGI